MNLDEQEPGNHLEDDTMQQLDIDVAAGNIIDPEETPDAEDLVVHVSQAVSLARRNELPLEQNPAAVYLAHLTPGGQRTMGEALDVIAGFLTGGEAGALDCRWWAVRFQHTVAVGAALATKYKASTANRMLSAMRGTLKTAWRLGQMTAEDYQRAADVAAVRGHTVPAGRELRGGEIYVLIQACIRDTSPAGARDAAIVGLMYAAGLRREEVVALNVADYDQESSRLLIRGKGNKERNAYPEEGALDALSDWLSARGMEMGALPTY